jgi:hypothetical protein
MEPSILQTCKQIYGEGNLMLYSQNVFQFIEPKQMFQLSAQIGLANLKLIRRLQICVTYFTSLPPWLQLLSMLARQATGLRHIELIWDLHIEFPCSIWHRGFGDNVDFVRALGTIQGLEKLVIKGYYAKNWPAYLSERMGVQVEAICGDCRDEPKLSGDPNDEELQNAKFIRELNERELTAFKKFQEGTEDLIP